MRATKMQGKADAGKGLASMLADSPAFTRFAEFTLERCLGLHRPRASV